MSDARREPEALLASEPKRALPALEPGVAQRVTCGLFAWGITVAPTAFGIGSSPMAALLGAAAAVCAIVGPALAARRRRLGRHVGITALLSLSLASWLFASDLLASMHLDVVRSVAGSVAWAMFALSWGEPWRRATGRAEELGPLLRPRSSLPSFAVPIAAMGVVASLALVALAWRVRAPERATLAQVLASALGIALVTVAGEIAVRRGRSHGARGATPFPPAARRPLVLLGIALVFGLAFAIAAPILSSRR